MKIPTPPNRTSGTWVVCRNGGMAGLFLQIGFLTIPNQKMHVLLGGGNADMFFEFSPRNLGRWSNVTTAHIFQLGCFNHQAVFFGFVLVNLGMLGEVLMLLVGNSLFSTYSKSTYVSWHWGLFDDRRCLLLSDSFGWSPTWGRTNKNARASWLPDILGKRWASTIVTHMQ